MLPHPINLNMQVSGRGFRSEQEVQCKLSLYVKGPGGPRFDVQGMVLPHSILGSLEDFRTEMQLRGETEVSVPDS